MLDNPFYKCPEPEFLWCCGLVSINVSYLIIGLSSQKEKNKKKKFTRDRPYTDGTIKFSKARRNMMHDVSKFIPDPESVFSLFDRADILAPQLLGIYWTGLRANKPAPKFHRPSK